MGANLSTSEAVLRVPPSPSILLANPVDTYQPERPRGRKQDTPLNVVYRIYWAIVVDNTFALRNEIEYFWTRKGEAWKVCNIPKPSDSDAERYAIVSAIPFILVAAFNRLIELGLPREAVRNIMTNEEYEALKQMPKVLESVPDWAAQAPPLQNPLRLPTKGHSSPERMDEDGVDEFMAKKNVLVWQLHVFFA